MTWTAQKYARNRSNGPTLKNVSLRYSWHATLYPFQVYNMVIQRVYTLCRTHHGVSIVTIYHHTTLLQHYWLYSLHFSFPWLIYNWKFVSLNTPPHLKWTHFEGPGYHLGMICSEFPVVMKEALQWTYDKVLQVTKRDGFHWPSPDQYP